MLHRVPESRPHGIRIGIARKRAIHFRAALGQAALLGG